MIAPLAPDGRPSRGMTPAELSALIRIGADRIRSMCRSGEMPSINTAPPGARPRFIVMPHHLLEWEQRHQAAKPKPAPRRRRVAAEHDYYPD